MENSTRPQAPNKSEGCYHCGGGKDTILTSLTIKGTSVAICDQDRLCLDIHRLLRPKPADWYK